MSNISQFTDCSGCGACRAVCPVAAITMEDSGLFYRPVVAQESCIHCGACLEVCPVNAPQPGKEPLSAWAAVHKEAAVVDGSSSGGAFTALAQAFMDAGGVVFGAAYSDDCHTVTITKTDRSTLWRLRKSKYTESRTGDSFQEAKRLLDGGTPVLYCGAPCQIAGLKRFLGEDPPQLLTCDFSCGGMSSHRLYQEHLALLERKYGARVAAVDFRPKTLGWEHYSLRVCFQNGRVYHRPAKLDPYLSAFVEKGYSVSDLCLSCPFAQTHSADIVLADFWRHRDFPGWETPGNGISLILINTEKAEQWRKRAASSLRMGQLELPKAAYNLTERRADPTHLRERQAFLRDCGEIGLWASAKRHCLPSGTRAWKAQIKAAARYLLRSIK